MSDGVETASAQVTITVTAVNDAPVVAALQPDLDMEEDTPTSFILADDLFADVDGPALSLTLRAADGGAAPLWISFDPATRTLTATPPANYNGTTALVIEASDGSLTASQQFDLTVTPVNDTPVLTAPLPDRLAHEGEAFDIALMQNTAVDPDGDVLTPVLTMADGSALPTWLGFDAGTFALIGTVPAGTFGAFDMKMTWTDPSGAEVRDFFTLDVLEQPDPPVFAILPEDVYMPESQVISLSLPEGMVTDDNAGDVITVTARLADGSELPHWLHFDGTTFTGQAPADGAGAYEITLDATDGMFTVSESFTLTILAVNDAPFAFDDGPFTVNADQRTIFDQSSLLANDIAPEGDAMLIIAVEGAQHGTLSMQADGDIVYDPATGFIGGDSFVYTVIDEHGASAQATVQVTVTDPYAGYQQGSDRSGAYVNTRGNTAYDAGRGNDVVITGRGNDSVAGGAGNDMLSTGAGNDLVDGGTGNDFILAGNGNDTIRGGEGRDVVSGGKGNDTFIYETGDGSDTILDFTSGHSRRNLRLGLDTIMLSVDGIEDFDSLLMHASQTRGGVLFDFGNGDELFLAGTRLASLDRDSFTFF